MGGNLPNALASPSHCSPPLMARSGANQKGVPYGSVLVPLLLHLHEHECEREHELEREHEHKSEREHEA